MIWAAIGSIATAVAAGFTAWMVFLTRRGIQQNVEQHKDGHRPTLVFLPDQDASEGSRMRVLQCAFMPPVPSIRRLVLIGVVRNIGVGPAINGRMTLRVRGIEGYGPDALSLPPIGVGDFFGKRNDSIPLPLSYRDGFTDTDAQSAPGEHWELVLEYEDVFGRVFHTVHSKNPQVPWTTIGRGPAPKGRDPRDVAKELQLTAQIPAGAPFTQ
jgi:hypothetical protein